MFEFTFKLVNDFDYCKCSWV